MVYMQWKLPLRFTSFANCIPLFHSHVDKRGGGLCWHYLLRLSQSLQVGAIADTPIPEHKPFFSGSGLLYRKSSLMIITIFVVAIKHG